MRPHQHPNNNDVLAAPPGVPNDECGPLFISRVVYPDGMPGVASYWMPTAAELALLKNGMPVRIMIWGRTHPPIHIGVDGDGEL